MGQQRFSYTPKFVVLSLNLHLTNLPLLSSGVNSDTGFIFDKGVALISFFEYLVFIDTSC